METQYKCHKCQRSFGKFAGLRAHRSRVHPLDYVQGWTFAMKEVRMNRVEEWILQHLVGEEE